MSSPQPMPSARRRPIPGMVSEPVAPPPPNPTEADELVAGGQAAATSVTPPLTREEPAGRVEAWPSQGLRGDGRSAVGRPPERRPRRRATTAVVPDPANGSMTTPPSGEHALMKNSVSPSGMAAV